MEIGIINQQQEVKLDIHWLQGITHRILTELGLSEKELSVLLVNNEQIKELNQRYLKRATVTDVLAFPMQEGVGSGLVPQLLGDVVISVPQALCQAKQQGHSLQIELATLLVHGILHLLGYTDYSEPATKEMFQRQEQLLQQVLPQAESSSP